MKTAKWLKSKRKKGSRIIVDDGAKNAILKKGVPFGDRHKRSSREFSERRRGRNCGLGENVIRMGQSNYKATQIKKIRAQFKGHSEILDTVFEEEVVHRDNMVVFS